MKLQDNMYVERGGGACEASRKFMVCWKSILQMHGKFWEIHAAVGSDTQVIFNFKHFYEGFEILP